MRLEFWFAARLGRVWLRVSARLRERFADVPRLCDAIAVGDQVPPWSIIAAQNFAGRVWAWSGMTVLLLAFPVIAVAAALHAGRSGAHWAAAIVGLLGSFCIMSLLQMAILTWRAFCIGGDLRDRRPDAGSMRRYPRYDFWLAVTPAIAFYVILIDAPFK